MEHVRALCDGLLITVPAAIGMGLEPVYVLLSIFCCVFLNAGKNYTELLARYISGKNAIGVVYTLVKMVFQGILITSGIIGGLLGGIFTGFTKMVLILTGVNAGLFVIALIMASISSFLFERMDCAE